MTRLLPGAPGRTPKMHCLIASSSSIINALKTNIYLEDAAVDIYTAEISAMGIILLEPESAINLSVLSPVEFWLQHIDA